MGTTFFTDKMMPADVFQEKRGQRQVEILRPSGEDRLVLRLGELDEEHQGRGHAVWLNESDAREVLSGLVAAMNYIGFRTEDLT